MNCEICGNAVMQSKYSNAVLCSSECFKAHYWVQKAVDYAANPDRYVVVEHEVYRIFPDLPVSRNKEAGFGGRLFKFVRLRDKQVVASRNVTHNGRVPVAFRGLIPDNAAFYDGWN